MKNENLSNFAHIGAMHACVYLLAPFSFPKKKNQTSEHNRDFRFLFYFEFSFFIIKSGLPKKPETLGEVLFPLKRNHEYL